LLSRADRPCDIVIFDGPRHGAVKPEKVDRISQRSIFPDMATVLKRLLPLGLAVTFLVGVAAQLMPSSMAETQMTVSAEMGGGCAAPETPCTGHMPNCIDHICCVTISALPTSVSTGSPLEWISLDYDRAAGSLTGISVKPELSPPILAA